MILPKVLKFHEYRGVKIYVRRLGGETFEYLIPHKGQIYQNQVEIARPSGQRMRKYTEDELEKSVSLMVRTAEMFLDDLFFQEEIYNQWRNKLERSWEKLIVFINKQIIKIETKINEIIQRYRSRGKERVGQSEDGGRSEGQGSSEV